MVAIVENVENTESGEENKSEFFLREVRPGDLPFFFEFQKDPQASHMAAFIGRDPCDRSAFDAHWQKILADASVNLRTIVFRGTVVGSVGSFVMDGKTEVTYGIKRSHWGKGLATRALNTFLQEVRERPLYGSAAADNLASIRVLDKCGFRIECYKMSFALARGKEIEEAVLRLD